MISSLYPFTYAGERFMLMWRRLSSLRGSQASDQAGWKVCSTKVKGYSFS